MPFWKVTVLDDQECRRKYHISNGISKARITPFETHLPVTMYPGWNDIELNMAEVTQKVYGTNFVECTRIHIHANCRLRRVYFADKAYSDEELPQHYKLIASPVPLKPGLYGVGSDKRSDNKVQLELNAGYAPPTLVS